METNKKNIKLFEDFINELNVQTYRNAAKIAKQQGDYHLAKKLNNKAESEELNAEMDDKMDVLGKIKNEKDSRVNFIINDIDKEYYIDLQHPHVTAQLDADNLEIRFTYYYYDILKWKKYAIYFDYILDVEDVENFGDSYYKISGENAPYKINNDSLGGAMYQVNTETGEEIGNVENVGLTKQGYLKFVNLMKKNFSYIENHHEVKKNKHEYNLAVDSFKRLISTNKLKRFFTIHKRGVMSLDSDGLKHSEKMLELDLYNDGSKTSIPEKLDVSGLGNAFMSWLDSPKGRDAKKHLTEYFNEKTVGQDNANFFELVTYFAKFVGFSLNVDLKKLQGEEVVVFVFIFESITGQTEELIEEVNKVGKLISDNY